MVHKLPLKTTPGYWYMAAVLIMFLPLQWVAAFLISSFVHEICHIIATHFTGVKIRTIRLCASGIYLDTDNMTPWQQMVCSLAGPIGALGLLFFGSWLPRTAICAAIQSCYHLLPVYPQDGGRALRSWTNFIGMEYREEFCMTIETVCLVLLCLAGLYLTLILKLGILPLIIFLTMIFRVCREKYLAKQPRKGYNIPTN